MTSTGSSRPVANRSCRGVTLIEIAIVVAVAAVVATSAVPSLAGLIDTRRIDGAASQMASDLQFARASAVLRSQPVRVSFHGDASGASCYVVHTGAQDACRCSSSGESVCEGDASLLKGVALDAGAGIAVQSNVDSLQFDPLHGTASPAATVRISGPRGRSVQQVVNVMGRVRSCSPQATVPGYTAC